MGNGYVNRQIDRAGTKGSVLLIVLGVVAALALTGSLMLSKYEQNARGARTSGAAVESNALFHSIQQSINNEALCSKAFQNSSYSYSLTTVQTGSVPPTLNLNNGLTAMVGSNQVPIATPGMKLNGVSIPPLDTSPGSASPIQLTGGSLYMNYGQQPAVGLPTDNLYCATVNLHITASTENRTIASTGQRSTMGSSIVSQDFPMTIFTDSNGQIRECFGGVPPSGLCAPASPASVSAFTVGAFPPTTPGCIDTTPGSTATVTWTGTGIATANLTCGGVAVPVPPADLLTGGVTITEALLGDLGPAISCTLTGTNSAGVAFAPATSNLFGSETNCVPAPVVNIYIAPATQTCVNTGTPYVIGWTDTDLNPLATVAITGGYTYTGPLINNPSPPGGYTMPAPAAPGLVSFTIQDTLGGLPASTSIIVMTAPTAPVLSASTTTYPASAPVPLTFTWTVPTGDTSFTLVGPQDSTNITTAASTASITPPSAVGFYTYTVTGSGGGCPGTPAIVSNIVTVNVTPGSGGPTCGTANGVADATAPTTNLCSDASTPAVTVNGSNWNWTCGTAPTCVAPDTAPPPTPCDQAQCEAADSGGTTACYCAITMKGPGAACAPGSSYSPFSYNMTANAIAFAGAPNVLGSNGCGAHLNNAPPAVPFWGAFNPDSPFPTGGNTCCCYYSVWTTSLSCL